MAGITSRRQFAAGLAGVFALSVAGCGRSVESEPTKRSTVTPVPQPSPKTMAMTVYRDPGCGCCEQWGQRAQEAGFTVSMINSDDMPAIKRQLGVPAQLASCHTAVVGDYVVEGHVPLGDVKRMLRTRPPALAGLAVPGMPSGSPGMEMPDGSSEPFKVMAFDDAGQISVFTEQRG